MAQTQTAVTVERVVRIFLTAVITGVPSKTYGSKTYGQLSPPTPFMI